MSPEAIVDVDCPALASLRPADRAVFERHARSSLRWSVREERGHRFAIRLEPSPVDAADAASPLYDVTLNGFYSDFDAPEVLQTRVLVGLGYEYGFGNDDVVLRVAARARRVTVPLEQESGQPGLKSLVIERGGADTTVEVYEQSRHGQRPFTQRALGEVCDELTSVLAARDRITRDGFAADLVPPGSVRHGTPTLVVEDGVQRGIYRVTAWVNPGASGTTWLRVFSAGPAPSTEPGTTGVPPELARVGTEASPERIADRSRCAVGWGADATALFRCQSEVTLYEGDWSSRFRARFELWFQPDGGGAARRLIDATRVVAGWES